MTWGAPVLDLSDLPLPSLTSDLYPVVAHAPLCTDNGPIDGRTCHPVVLHRPRRYALPTVPLGRLRSPRGHRPVLPPLPPSLGTHCATIKTSNTVSVGDAASVTSDVDLRSNDACRPTINTRIVMPCTKIEAKTEVTAGGGASAVFEPKDKRDAKHCIQELLLKLNFPGCTKFKPVEPTVTMVSSGSAQWTRTAVEEGDPKEQCFLKLIDVLKIPCVVPTLSNSGVYDKDGNAVGSFEFANIGDKCNRTIAVKLNFSQDIGGGAFSPAYVVDGSAPTSLASACVAGYGFGRIVPVRDTYGQLGDVGSVVDPYDYKIVNKSSRVLVPGDVVELVIDPAEVAFNQPKNVYIMDRV